MGKIKVRNMFAPLLEAAYEGMDPAAREVLRKTINSIASARSKKTMTPEKAGKWAGILQGVIGQVPAAIDRAKLQGIIDALNDIKNGTATSSIPAAAAGPTTTKPAASSGSGSTAPSQAAPVSTTRTTGDHAEELVPDEINDYTPDSVLKGWGDLFSRIERADEMEKRVRHDSSNTKDDKLADGTVMSAGKDKDGNQVTAVVKTGIPYGTDISKIDHLDIEYSDGRKDVIQPKRLAELTDAALGVLSEDPLTNVLREFMPKRVIWTFGVGTAATDGVRVLMNPCFADKMFTLDNTVLKPAALAANPNMSKVEVSKIIGRSLRYVLIHELYHQVYRHGLRESLKPETTGGKNHDLANIAMDVEINRDLEMQFRDYRGCTKAVGGCWDERFPHETWETIFDAYYKGEATPPQVDEDHPTVKLDDHIEKEVEVDWQDGPAGPPPPPTPDKLAGKSADFLKGYNEIIKKVKAGIIDIDDPSTYSNFMMNAVNNAGGPVVPAGVTNAKDYNAGRQEALADIKKAFDEIAKQGGKVVLNKNGQGGPEGPDSPVKIKPKNPLGGDPSGKGGEGNSDPDNGRGNDPWQQGGSQNQQGGSQNQNQNGGDSGQNGGQNGGQGGDPGQNGGQNGGQGGDPWQNGGQNGGQGGDPGQNGGDPGQNGGDPGQNGGEPGQNGGDPGQNSGEPGQKGGQGGDGDETIDGNQFAPVKVDDKKFGGCDILDQNTARELAKAAGQPYDADDLKDEKQREYEGKIMLDKLKKTAQAHSRGGGKMLLDALLAIDALLPKPIGNWKSMLKAFFNAQAKTNSIFKMDKKHAVVPELNPLWGTTPKEHKYDEKVACAQVFYLIDNSGSMYGQSPNGGEMTFDQLFSEILDMQKKCKIKMSCLTYFSTGALDVKKIRRWTDKDNLEKVRKMIARNHDDSGGTDIVGSIKNVMALKKPYFQTSQPRTLLFVMTDGEDNLDACKELPAAMKKNVIWILVNSSQSALSKQFACLLDYGFLAKNILLVDASKL